MAANYKMEKNPNPKGEEEQVPLHPRIVPHGTVNIEELMKYAKDRSTFSTTDMKGALQILSDLVTERLKEGYNVELEGIGFFSLSLQSRKVMDKSELRSESIHFKNVNFRCCAKMKKELKSIPLTRLKETNKESFSDDEKEYRLNWYLARHPYITTSTYRGLNPCSKYTAMKELKQFVANGKLIEDGTRKMAIYLKPLKPEEENTTPPFGQ